MWFTTSSGRIELQLTQDDVEMGYHSGSCDSDIADLRRVPRIAAQLNDIDAETLRQELKEYGAWDADELADHDANQSRILWLACGDLFDNPNDEA
jgi:hypothetical protein